MRPRWKKLIVIAPLAILGMLYKILPFLVWYGTYSRHIGARKVPSLADLYSQRIQAAQFAVYLVALAVAGGGIDGSSAPWVRIGFGMFAVALGLFAVNAAKMLSHLVWPQVQPLTAPVVLAKKV